MDTVEHQQCVDRLREKVKLTQPKMQCLLNRTVMHPMLEDMGKLLRDGKADRIPDELVDNIIDNSPCRALVIATKYFSTVRDVHIAADWLILEATMSKEA